MPRKKQASKWDNVSLAGIPLSDATDVSFDPDGKLPEFQGDLDRFPTVERHVVITQRDAPGKPSDELEP